MRNEAGTPARRTILYVTKEGHPSSRPDIQDLWGTHLPRHGVESILVARREPGTPAPWGGGRTVLCGPFKGRYLAAARTLRHEAVALWTLARLADALQVRDKYVTGLVMLAVARLRRKPCFYWMSFPYPEDDLNRLKRQGARLGPLRALLTLVRGLAGLLIQYRLLLPACDHVFVQSPAMADMLGRRGIPASAMTVVPMCVDMERMAATPPARGSLPPGGPVIVHLGALDRTREPWFLVDVLARLRQRVPGAVLVFIGDAPEAFDREMLLDHARRAGLEQAVHVTGWLPRDEAWALAAQGSVGVSALPDGLVTRTMSPTKTVELMALGLPMVVSEHPDMGPLVNDSGGGTVAPRQAGDFAEAIAAILESPEQARTMGDRGRAFVRAHRSYEALARALAATYASLTRPGPGTNP